MCVVCVEEIGEETGMRRNVFFERYENYRRSSRLEQKTNPVPSGAHWLNQISVESRCMK